MKNILKFLSILIFSQTYGFATPVEEFKNQLGANIKRTLEINKCIQSLTEEKYAEYFQKEGILSHEVSSIKNNVNIFTKKISGFFHSISDEQWKSIGKGTTGEQKTLISQRIILTYCEMLPLASNLHKCFIDNQVLVSPYTQNVDALISYFNFLSHNLQMNEERLIPFMTVSALEKKNTVSYNVKINFVAYVLQQKRRARFLVSAIDGLDFSAFQLPTTYAKQLKETLLATKKKLTIFL